MGNIGICRRDSNAVIYSGEHDDLGEAVLQAYRNGISLESTMLAGVKLRYYRLPGVNFRNADLRNADMYNGRFREGNFAGADLTAANISSTIFTDAELSGCILPHGQKYEDYLATLPALLTATGKTIKEVLDTGCWKCHSWENCPMRVVFGIKHQDHGPQEWQEAVSRFVDYFDAMLLPEPYSG